MIPLRSALIVQEHGVLPYPEGTACAEVLLAGEKGGAKARNGFLRGLGIAAVYKFIADGLRVFPSEVDFEVKSYKGAGNRYRCASGTVRSRLYLRSACGILSACRRSNSMVCHYACDCTIWRGCCFISGYGTDQRTWGMGYLEQLHPLYRCRSRGGGRYFQSDQSIAADHTDFCTGSPRLWKKYGRGIQNIARISQSVLSLWEF